MSQPMPMPRRDLGAIQMRAERTRRLRSEPRHPPKGPVRVGLWLPTTLIFLLLAPFALLLIPFLYLTPRRIVPAPARSVVAIGALLLSLGGTEVDVDAADARVRIRLF